MRFIPDWLVYTLALLAIVGGVFANTPDEDAPPATPDSVEREGATLPPPSAFDETVLVRVESPKDGIGTAFSIDTQGHYLTARHVVEGCDDVSLLVAPGQYLPVENVSVSERSDLALLVARPSLAPVALDTSPDLRIGSYGFHVGYPQGRPGEASSRLIARSRLVMSGLRSGEESVLAWAETGRTSDLEGPLGGLSGGPVYDDQGRVRGVIIAESPRRGRIYSASPEAISRFLDDQGIEPLGERPLPITPDSYGGMADRARQSLQVVKVACEVGNSS
ncbi:S1 family peptidase [Henriciella mobilis]|uniref:Serine protease n=1 Tax=Henriciella mobilis TaxID=2305467 RepID=A0A399RKE0_9PROT|nr:serine protease [Henriciella mobilis]RIJ18035.1 serine protease [Henriciella mobilis]RIJ25156.1 serine protease [Henriciella mobilis]RIJ30219.1 serine protease [Henriciella mobilis]